MNGPRDPASRAAKRILSYLARHREAADTAQGIAAWWLSDAPPVTVAVAESALTQLVEQGLVERQALPDGTVIYRGAWARQQKR